MQTKQQLRRWLRPAKWGAVAALLLCVGLGLGHVVGKRFAGRHPGSSCPFGGAGKAGLNIGAQQHIAADTLRGSGLVTEPRLLDLQVGRTDRKTLDAWLAEHGCTCRQRVSPLECACLSPARFGPLYAEAQKSTAFLTLDDRDTLHEVVLLTTFVDAKAAMSAFVSAQSSWNDSLGPISQQLGSCEEVYLAGGMLRQTRTEFRRQNVYAKISATNFGDHYNLEQRLSQL